MRSFYCISTNAITLQLRKIIRAIRVSPQRKKRWLALVREIHEVPDDILQSSERQRALVLILDVKTRWSSTHQMMSKSSIFILNSHVDPLYIYYLDRALKYRKCIDDFVGRTRELRYLELDDSEWDAIAHVADWLKLFRSATTQMSKSKGHSMLSSTHAIFWGLQEHIANIYRNIPDSAPHKIKDGLLDAHRKLSDYYYKYDQSPLYTWAACESFLLIRPVCDLT